MFLSLHTDAVLILREDSALAAVVGVFAKIICVGSLSFFASAYYTVDKTSTTFWWIGVMNRSCHLCEGANIKSIFCFAKYHSSIVPCFTSMPTLLTNNLISWFFFKKYFNILLEKLRGSRVGYIKMLTRWLIRKLTLGARIV